MDSIRKTAIIVGVLFLTAIATYNLGIYLIESVIDDSDYLINISTNENKLIFAALLILIDGSAVVCLAVLLYPILKKYNEPMALGYVGFRIIECIMLIVAVISTLLLLTLSQEYVNAGAPEDSYFHTMGTLLQEVRYWTYQIGILIFSSVFGTMLAYILHQSKLVPRYISVIGLIGYPLWLPVALMDMYGLNEGVILALPGALFEIILPIWLIIYGFDPAASRSGPARADPGKSK